MDLLLKSLMILGSAILIFNAAARPDSILLFSIVGMLLIMGAGFILLYRRSKNEN
ncbi:LPXTG cell wall anchor domain-containing protein [Jeotgalicoccus sp. WY2]|uniref:LPXTG cell wall anchor domain-containing protein n=1 Tax=Jeotgalicoccus sp. WY2 TaxID=2708346 RepID=UPI001BD36E14